MAVVIQEFEVTPTASPAPPAAAPVRDANPADTRRNASPAEDQRAAMERHERALRLFAH